VTLSNIGKYVFMTLNEHIEPNEFHEIIQGDYFSYPQLDIAI